MTYKYRNADGLGGSRADQATRINDYAFYALSTELLLKSIAKDLPDNENIKDALQRLEQLQKMLNDEYVYVQYCRRIGTVAAQTPS